MNRFLTAVFCCMMEQLNKIKMKKIILGAVLFLILAILLGGGIAMFAKDAQIFDRFYSGEEKEQRILNRMVKLFPENIGDFHLYGPGPEKIRKENRCEQYQSEFRGIKLDIFGEVCNRNVIAEYRNGNKVVFVYLMSTTKGKDVFDSFVKKFSKDGKLGDYNVKSLEKQEISWFVENAKNDVEFVSAQEALVTKYPDGSESMDYRNKATGENPVTQYFLSKFPSAKLLVDDLSTCNDSDGNNANVRGDAEGNFRDLLNGQVRKEKVRDGCVGDADFTLQDKAVYVQMGILTKEQSENKNILLEAVCDKGFIKILPQECANGCQNGFCK